MPKPDQKGILLTALPILGVALSVAALSFGKRLLLNPVSDSIVDRLVRDPYHENLWQMITELRRVGAQQIQETEMRARSSHPLMRPLGSPSRRSGLNRISFDLAQLSTLPTCHTKPINLTVTIGPSAQKPLQLPIPIIVGAIENTFLLNNRIREALALGAAEAGTALNAGNAAPLAAERKASRYLIMQYHRGNWLKPEALTQADAVEIVLGEGPGGSTGTVYTGLIESEALQSLGLPRESMAFDTSGFALIKQPSDLATLVTKVRSIAPGVPVGIRITANQSLEQDLKNILTAGVEFVTLSTAEAGTMRNLPIFQDDFGIPTLWGVHRAHRFLEQHDPNHRVSLIVNGGLSTAGDILKCLALGADVISLCSTALFAAMSGQQKGVLPFEPPPVMLLQNPRYARKFSVEQGAKNVSNWISSTMAEITAAVRALGKNSIHELKISDLCALDLEAANAIGIPFAAYLTQSNSEYGLESIRHS